MKSQKNSFGKVSVLSLAVLGAVVTFGLAGCAQNQGARQATDDTQTQTAITGSDVLPIASGMKRYVLDNGLTVLVYPRKDPRESAEFRLVVRAGSLQETENERGLAHFVEHMAFNGTQDFPGQTIFKRLEEHGIMLGVDVNAVTSLADTTYKLSIGRSTGESLQEAIHTLSQWAFHITFEEEAFNREREIIVEEWRLRQGIGSRINNPLQSLRYKGSASADRDPIGLIDIIRTAPAQRAKDFYKRWYEPQNMTLCVTGDYDTEEVMEQVRKYFGDVPRGTHTTPTDWGRFTLSKNQAGLTALIFDEEQSDRFVQVMLQEKLENPLNTVNGQWRDMLERLTLEILSERFRLIGEHELVGSLQAPDSSWVLSPSQSQVLLLVRPKAQQSYEEALAIASTEIHRLAQIGPTQTEVDVALKKYGSKLTDQAENYARYANRNINDQIAEP
ncbi:MAG: insulinase family protein, partial [Sutterellaceae bacterium]|nr:insulinase family protein [Sutterellaceae bacterium]